MSIWVLFGVGYALVGLLGGIVAEVQEERRRAKWNVLKKKYRPEDERPWKPMGAFWLMFLAWPFLLPFLLVIEFHDRIEKLTKRLARVDEIPEVAAENLKRMEKEVDL